MLERGVEVRARMAGRQGCTQRLVEDSKGTIEEKVNNRTRSCLPDRKETVAEIASLIAPADYETPLDTHCLGKCGGPTAVRHARRRARHTLGSPRARGTVLSEEQKGEEWVCLSSSANEPACTFQPATVSDSNPSQTRMAFPARPDLPALDWAGHSGLCARWERRRCARVLRLLQPPRRRAA